MTRKIETNAIVELRVACAAPLEERGMALRSIGLKTGTSAADRAAGSSSSMTFVDQIKEVAVRQQSRVRRFILSSWFESRFR